MLSRNVLIFSAVAFLATTVSTAPVEEKEPDETELEVEDGEEELSEEEDDDDDSKIQDMNMGAGSQRATMAPKDTGATSQHEASVEGDPFNGHKVNGGSPTHTGHDSSSSAATAGEGIDGGQGAEAHQPSDSSSHADPSAEMPTGSSVETGIAAGAMDHGISTSQVHHPGAADAPSGSISHGSGTQMGSSSGIISEVHPKPSGLDLHQSTLHIASAGDQGAFDPGSQVEAPEATGSDAPDAESNGNGHKLLIGRTPEGPAGTDHIADGTAHIDSAGPVDHSVTDLHIDLTDHTGTITQIASTDLGSDPGLSSSSVSHPDAPGVGDTGAFGGHSHAAGETVGAGNHDVPISFISDTTDIALLSDMMSHTDHSHIDYPESAVDASSTDSADTNGNGRQGPVTEMHQTGSQLLTDTDATVVTGGVETHTIVPQTDAIDLGVEPATSSHILADATVPGDILNSTSLDAAGFEEMPVTSGHTNTTDSLLGVGRDAGSTVTGDALKTVSQTDAVGGVTADPKGIHKGLSQSDTTPQAQPAAPAAEQYITSGQGPQGAENVELEDSC